MTLLRGRPRQAGELLPVFEPQGEQVGVLEA
jgi:hypothetical protein